MEGSAVTMGDWKVVTYLKENHSARRTAVRHAAGTGPEVPYSPAWVSGCGLQIWNLDRSLDFEGWLHG